MDHSVRRLVESLLEALRECHRHVSVADSNLADRGVDWATSEVPRRSMPCTGEFVPDEPTPLNAGEPASPADE
jgi:hypothetical protein